MLEFYLVRHAQSLANIGDRVGGGMRRVPLSEEGELQAAKLGEYLRGTGIGFTHVYSSPTRRTIDTGEIAGFPSLTIEPRLIEIDRGAWTGRRRIECYTPAILEMLKGDGVKSWEFKTPGGESTREVEERASAWLHELKSLDGNAIAFSHQVTIGTLIRHVKQDDPREVFKYPLPNTGITRLTYDGSWNVWTIGKTPHLS